MGFLRESVRNFFLTSTMHGFNFLSERDRHWSERIFWIACCALAWVGTGMLMEASWDKFNTNAISFAVETDYIDWITPFPAVHVCETEHANLRLEGYTSYDMAEIYGEIAFFRGLAPFIFNTCFRPDGSVHGICPQDGLYEKARKVNVPCGEMIIRCLWNGHPFDCCQEFEPLQTEVGLCYSMNSMQTLNKQGTLNFLSNHSSGPGKLIFEVTVPSEVFWLSRPELPLLVSSSQLSSTVSPGRSLQLQLAVRQLANSEGVRAVSPRQRRCRFADEQPPPPLRAYSYSACVTRCRADAQMRLCNCTSHQTPGAARAEICDLRGLACLHRNYLSLSALRHRDSRSSNLHCPCFMSCEGEVIDKVYELEQLMPQNSTAVVETVMSALPTERYKRYVVRGIMDLVVSMGGSASLFVGASLLSFAELIYHFTLRLCVDWRWSGRRGRGRRSGRQLLSSSPAAARSLARLRY